MFIVWVSLWPRKNCLPHDGRQLFYYNLAMETELEAKFLEIDKGSIRAKLRQIGAELVTEERLMQRVVFESDYLRNNRAWLRVRNEGSVTKLTLKQASDATDITRIKEAEVSVGNFDDTKTILNGLGLEEKRYQESRRESWKFKDVSIEIDSWPLIPPYIEIEAGSETEVKDVASLLGFDYSTAVFGSADEVFKDTYGIDILSMEKLEFER